MTVIGYPERQSLGTVYLTFCVCQVVGRFRSTHGKNSDVEEISIWTQDKRKRFHPPTGRGATDLLFAQDQPQEDQMENYIRGQSEVHSHGFKFCGLIF